MKKERKFSNEQLCVYGDKSNVVRNSKLKHSTNFYMKGPVIEVSGDDDVCLSRSLVHFSGRHLSRKHRYFEVKFLSAVTKDQIVMIGLNPRSNSQPTMWDKDRSIRYCTVEGGVFTGGAGLRSDNPFGNEGDVVTIYLEACFKKSSLINFFLNGNLVYRQWIDVSKKHLYPTIGVSKGPAKLYVIWPGQTSSPSVQCCFDKVHSFLRNWIGYRHIKKDDEDEILELTDHDHTHRKGYSIQAPRPLDHAPDMGPAIGLTSAWTSKFQYPGWTHDTIGYHSDEGSFYNDHGFTSSNEPDTSLQCQVGDRMGCGIVFSSKDHTECQRVTIYFTRNKEIVYVKHRMLPLGGFYPTVGMYEVGEQVRVINPYIDNKVTLPKHELIKIKPCEILYKKFKFHETISFDDFLSSGSIRRISMKYITKTAQMIHHISGPKDLYCLKFEIIELDKNCEIYIRSVPRCYTTTNRYVFNDITLKDVLCLSQKTGLSVGDKVFVTIQVYRTGLQITAIKNGRSVGHTFAANDGSANWEDQMPTLAFQYGCATLDVVWPGSAEFKNIRNNKTSITDYINEHVSNGPKKTEKEIIQNESCKHVEDENEAPRRNSGNVNKCVDTVQNVASRQNITITDHRQRKSPQNVSVQKENDSNLGRRQTDVSVDATEQLNETNNINTDSISGKDITKTTSVCTVM